MQLHCKQYDCVDSGMFVFYSSASLFGGRANAFWQRKAPSRRSGFPSGFLSGFPEPTGGVRAPMIEPSRADLLPPLLQPEAWPQRLSRLLAWLAGALILFGCSGLISIDVITRLIFGRGIVESFELSGYAMAAAIGLGLAFTVTSKANVRVDILLDFLPRSFRAPCDLIASLSLSVIALALAWFCWKTVGQSLAMDARSISTLQVPMAIPQAIWWAGIFWFALIAVLIPLQAMVRLIRRDRPGFDAMIGSLRVNEEMSHAGVGARPPGEPGP